MTDKQSAVSFEQVQQVASEMLTQGVKPTVRGVRGVTGGRTETVADYLDKFNRKRDDEVSKIADEIGSSEVGKLIAGEIQAVVDRRTASLNEIMQRQEAQIAELIELMSEKEQDCEQRITVITEDAEKTVNTSTEKANKAIVRAELAESDKLAFESDIEKITNSADNKVELAQAESRSLIQAANTQTEKSQLEASALREQVKLLSVDEAMRELEKEQLSNAQRQLEQMRIDIAESKTNVVRLESQNISFEKDTNRLEGDLIELKKQAGELPKSQAQLVESQKQISQLQNELSQSEREKESLSRALAVSEVKK